MRKMKPECRRRFSSRPPKIFVSRTSKGLISLLLATAHALGRRKSEGYAETFREHEEEIDRSALFDATMLSFRPPREHGGEPSLAVHF